MFAPLGLRTPPGPFLDSMGIGEIEQIDNPFDILYLIPHNACAPLDDAVVPRPAPSFTCRTTVKNHKVTHDVSHTAPWLNDTPPLPNTRCRNFKSAVNAPRISDGLFCEITLYL